MSVMKCRKATLEDSALLASLNYQLLQDEGHRNQKMAISELEKRMRGWLSSEYTAVLFEESDETVAYALYRQQSEEIFLRQ